VKENTTAWKLQMHSKFDMIILREEAVGDVIITVNGEMSLEKMAWL
jgi:hypothetical protein